MKKNETIDFCGYDEIESFIDFLDDIMSSLNNYNINNPNSIIPIDDYLKDRELYFRRFFYSPKLMFLRMLIVEITDNIIRIGANCKNIFFLMLRINFDVIIAKKITIIF